MAGRNEPVDRREQGALERAARDPVSRRRFLALSGSSAAAAALLAACGSGVGMTTGAGEETGGGSMGGGSMGDESMGGNETAQFGKGDLGIVNYALTLEYLEAAFYADVVRSGLFKGAELKTIEKFGQEEAEHVEALKAAAKQLGGKPAAEPKTEFPLESAKAVVALAAEVENLGAAAYLGQAARIENPEVLASALAIHSVEGRHAATLNQLLGESITPDGPFAEPADVATVLKSVEPFIAG